MASLADITPDNPTADGGFLGGGTLSGTNLLQTSIDALTRGISTLVQTISGSNSGSNRTGSYGWTYRGYIPTGSSGGPGGGPGGFPPVINPFNNNPNAPGIGGGGSGGAGNVLQPQPFSQSATLAGAGMLLGSAFQYGQNQLGTQLGLNAYVTQSQLGLANGGYYSNQLMTQAFGMYNRNLNAIASSPMDALAMTQQLQFLGGNPLYMNSAIGRAGYGAAAAFGLTNPTLSGAQSASLAQQIFSPQFSQQMIALGYGRSPRALGGGSVSGIGSIMQTILRGWYNKNSVSPGQLYSTLSQGGRGYANLSALGLDPNQAAPLLLGYNQLFNAGLSPAEATRLFEQGAKGGTQGQQARVTLAKYGVKTATSDIQDIKNAQSVLTGRSADVASGFNRGIADATGLLQRFNQMLTNILTSAGLNGPLGFMGGFGSILSGTNHGPGLLGIGGAGLLLGRLLGIGGLGGAAGAGAGGLAGIGGIFGGGLAGVLGPVGLGVAGTIGTSAIVNTLKSHSPTASGWLSNKFVNPLTKIGMIPGLQALNPGEALGILGWLKDQLFSNGLGHGSNVAASGSGGVINRFSSGGIVPGYQPGLDTIPAMISRGEAILNPGAARALGHNRINMLNALHKPAGSDTSLKGGVLHASGGYGSGGANSSTGYLNPFRSVSNLVPERVDMGVDYSGSGPVYAVGPGVVTNLYSHGWPNNTFISYQLTGGPDKGRFIYVAEDISPTVRVGQQVNSNTVIGRMFQGGSGIETGWASPPGTGNTLGASQFSGSNATAYGANMSRFLASLGAPAGVISGGITGSLPNGWGIGSIISGGIPGMGTSLGIGSPMMGIGGSGTTIGFSESSVIPNISELAALGGAMSGGSTGGIGGTPSLGNGQGNTNVNNGGAGGPSNPKGNVALGKALAAKRGWTGNQWGALYKLWQQESTWSNTARNPHSGAYGIAQALGHGPSNQYPAGKYMSANPPPYGSSNATEQILWGLDYIAGRYGNPSGAWAHEMAYNWYGSGGSASGIGIVGDRGPELVNFGDGGGVMSSAQTANLLRGNYARPAQSPWMANTTSSLLNTFTGGSGAHISIVFNEKSIVINSNGSMGSDASKAGREVARQIVQKIKNENIYMAIAEGNKY